MLHGTRDSKDNSDPFTRSGLSSAHISVEPPNKGHFGANSFVPCREVVPISEVK